jgi:hypothetical protein
LETSPASIKNPENPESLLSLGPPLEFLEQRERPKFRFLKLKREEESQRTLLRRNLNSEIITLPPAKSRLK